MSMRDISFGAPPVGQGLRPIAAALLRAASRGLDRMAVRLSVTPAPARVDTVIEFYAEAGAPEGALYVDGRLAGHLPGVRRL